MVTYFPRRGNILPTAWEHASLGEGTYLSRRGNPITIAGNLIVLPEGQNFGAQSGIEGRRGDYSWAAGMAAQSAQMPLTM